MRFLGCKRTFIREYLLTGAPDSHYRDGIHKLEDHWDTCIEIKGAYKHILYNEMYSKVEHCFFDRVAKLFQQNDTSQIAYIM